MLDTVVIEINKYRADDCVQQFLDKTGYNVEFDIENVTNAYNTFLITDSRSVANRANAKKIGFAVYLNDETKSRDFSDALYCIEHLGNIDDKVIERMHLRYLDRPWTIAETNRCIIREITVDDIDALYDIYGDDDTSRYIEKLYANKEDEIEFTRAYIANQYRFYEYGMWVVIDKSTGKLIGRAGITDREGFKYPEVGFIFSKKTWGHGYALEVLNAIIEYAKEDLFMDKLISFTMPQNVRAQKFLEKLLFTHTENVKLDMGDFYMYERKI